MKKFKRFILYLFTYVIMTFVSAFGVVLISNPTGANSIQVGESAAITSTPPQLNYIVNNLSATKAINANIEANIKTKTDNFNVNLDTEINLENGFENCELNGTILATINSSQVKVDFVYKDKVVYLSMLNGNYKVNTTNIVETLTQILTLLNIEMPNIDIGIDLNNLSLDTILQIFSNLTEERTATQNVLSINLPVVGTMGVVCDLNYAIKQIVLPETSIDDITFGVKANFDYPKKIEVETPENNYIEVTEMFNIAEAAINTLKQNEIGLNVNVLVGDTNLSGLLSADLKNYNAKFETKIFNNNVSIVAINNIVYFECGNINLKFPLSEANQITKMLKEQFNIEIPLTEITGMLTAIKNNDIANELAKFDLKTFDFNSINLELFESLHKENNTYTISLKDIGTLNVTLENHKLSQIKFNGFNILLNATLEKANPIKIKDVNHANLVNLIPTINSIITTTNQSLFNGTLSLNVNNQNLTANYVLQIKNGVYFNLNTTLFNKPFNLTILNNDVYLQYSNTYVSANINELPKLINSILEKLNVKVPANQLDHVIGLLNSIINSEVNPNLITNITEILNGVQIEILNDLKITLLSDTTLKSVNVSNNNFEVNLTINASTLTITPPAINKDSYTKVSDLTDVVLNLIDYVNAKQLYFNVNATYKNYNVVGNVYVDENVSFNLNTTLYGKTLNVKLLNNVVYANFDGFNVKFNLSDLNTVLSFVETNFGINVKAELQKLSNTKINVKDVLLKLCDLNFAITDETINIDYLNYFAQVNFKNHNLQSLTLTSDSINAEITKLENKQTIELDENYFNLIDIMPFANSVLNTIKTKAVAGNFNINYNGNNYVVNVKLSYNPTLQVWLQTNILGCDIRANYLNKTIYLSVDKLNVKFGLNEINKLSNFIQENVGIDISKFTSFKPSIDNINFSQIKIIEISNNSLKVNTFGATIDVLFDNYLNNVIVTYNNITAELNLTQTGKAVTLPVINKNAYENIDYLLTAASDLISTVKTKNIELSGNVNISNTNINYTAQIKFYNGLQAKVNLTVYGKQIEVIVLNGFAYINADDFMAKLDLNNLNNLFNELNTNFNIDINKTKQFNVLQDLFITEISKTNNNLNATVYYNNTPINLTVSLNTQNKLSNIKLNAFGINALASLKASTVTNYACDTKLYTTNLNSLTDLITPISNIVTNKQLKLNGSLKFNLLNSEQTLLVNNLALSFNNGLKANAKVEFNGITAEVTLLNNIVYVNANGLKIKLPIAQINNLISWVNSTFNTNINLGNFSDLKEFNFEEILNKFSFGSITLISKTPNGIVINLGSDQIFVDYTETLNKIVGNVFGVTLDLSVYSNNATINNVNDSEYVLYTELTNFTSSILNYFKLKQYGITANATVYNGDDGTNERFNASVNLQVNMLNTFEVSGSAKLTGEQDIGFDLNYYNKYLFVNYNNLKLKICENDLKELLVIALEMVGINPNILPFLTDVANGMDINIGNLGELLPGGDGSNPLSMLKIIKAINYYNNNIIITLNGKLISENPNADEMNITIKTNGNSLTNISITNLYTGVTDNEYFNLNVNFGTFDKVIAPVDNGYHDLSGANELIKAVVNTAELNYFEIDGSLKINGKVLSIFNLNWDVPLNIKVKLDENHKNPEVMAKIGEIPTMVGVNKSAGETAKERMFYIYYKNGFVYLYQTQKGKNDVFMEKVLKLSLEEALRDPLFCLQFGTGFSDTIMEQIYKSIEKAKGHTPNLGNVINYFKKPTETNPNYEIQINMEEITNDTMLGNITVGLGVINTAETKNKNYVGKATFNMGMPIAPGVFDLTLDSNNLTLINIGKTLDFSALTNFVNTYSSFTENLEMYREGYGEWQRGDEILYTLSFVTNCDVTVNSITAAINSQIEIPTFTTKVEVDTTNGTRKTYTFDGWYTDEKCKDGNKFTQSTMPRGNTTLYAKWNLTKTEKVVTLTFNSNGGTSYNSISEIANTKIDISSYVPHKHDDTSWNTWGTKHTHTRYTFEGWYTDEALTQKFNGVMPLNNTTLYAKYSSNTYTHRTAAWQCDDKCE